MSLEQPSFRAPANHSSEFISSSSSSFNSIVMPAAVQSTTVGTAVSPSPTTPPAGDWAPSQSRSSTTPCLISEEPQSSAGANSSSTDIDPQILEALRSKDRLWVLKLGELMEGLINERKPRVDVNPSTSYQRLLVHRCSAYYKLSPENDPLTKNIIIISLTVDSRIPVRRVCELVPAESTAQPAFKIMRRMPSDRHRQKPHSQAGSVAGDEGDLSDVEQSETGSLGGRSNASKKHLTIEEREAAYNEARSRIFMDFQEKEKEKEKDMSAGSSSQSIISGSASTSAGRRSSSIEDLDDSIGTPATDSEWSAPIIRDRKDVRSGSSAGPSSRSLRSSIPTYSASGQNGSRNSAATSPSFTYASLYEPPPVAAQYDPHQIAGKPTFVPQYQYGYQAPGNPPHGQQGYVGAYPNYPGYTFPPQAPMAGSDPANLSGQDAYMTGHQQHPAQYAPYPNPYLWGNAHQPPAISPAHSSNPTHQHPNHAHIAAQSTPQFTGPYMPSPSPYAPYPMPGYYPPPPGQQMSPPHVMSQPIYPTDPRAMHGMASGIGRGGPEAAITHQNNRTSSRSSGGHLTNGGSKRGAPPARAAWSYGPGIGMGGFGYGNPNGTVIGEVIGPRMNSVRRMSQTSSIGSNSTGNRTPGDEASSTASSSTTSSSSRRTYTSTTSSQHPLPPRPDWAVGLKPQSTLHSRHHEHSMSSSRSSPARHASQLHSQPMTPVVLQPTDFPPLTTVSPPPEKRTPVISGAWGNASSTRSILQASTQSGAAIGGRLEDPDRGFERPPPKSNAELFNPKSSRRPTSSNGRNNSLNQDKIDERTHIENPIDIADQLGSLSLGDVNARSSSAAEVA